MDSLETHIWFIIWKNRCSDNYHYNYYAIGSKLWALGVDYNPRRDAARVEELVHKVINHRNNNTPLYQKMDEYFSYNS